LIAFRLLAIRLNPIRVTGGRKYCHKKHAAVALRRPACATALALKRAKANCVERATRNRPVWGFEKVDDDE
jgi:hypothetical protein